MKLLVNLPLILILVFATACTAIDSFKPTPTLIPVEVLSSLTYAQHDFRQKLNLYLPATGERPYPTNLSIHGGGFTSRSNQLYQQIGPHSARQGYAFIIPVQSFGGIRL